MGYEARSKKLRREMGEPIPFAKNSQIPVVGQPFTLKTIYCPVTATLDCNCGGPEVAVTITGSVQGACPSCGKIFNMAFNPTQNKLEVIMARPQEEKPPS